MKQIDVIELNFDFMITERKTELLIAILAITCVYMDLTGFHNYNEIILSHPIHIARIIRTTEGDNHV